MIGTWITLFRKWQAERRAVEELARLSDERLLDLGLNRGTIVAAVRHGRLG